MEITGRVDLSKPDQPRLSLKAATHAPDENRSTAWSEFRNAGSLAQRERGEWVRAEQVARAVYRRFVEPRVGPFPDRVITQLFYGIGVPAKRKLPYAVDDKHFVLDDRRNSGVGFRMPTSGVFSVKIAGHDRIDFDVRGLSRRMQIEDTAAWPQEAVRTAQGIDHALTRQSSQRPRK